MSKQWKKIQNLRQYWTVLLLMSGIKRDLSTIQLVLMTMKNQRLTTASSLMMDCVDAFLKEVNEQHQHILIELRREMEGKE